MTGEVTAEVPTPQQERAARFVAKRDWSLGTIIKDNQNGRLWTCTVDDQDYARAIAAALNVNPPKESP